MEEILHQLIGRLSHYLQGFIHSRWLFGISSINSISSAMCWVRCYGICYTYCLIIHGFLVWFYLHAYCIVVYHTHILYPSLSWFSETAHREQHICGFYWWGLGFHHISLEFTIFHQVSLYVSPYFTMFPNIFSVFFTIFHHVSPYFSIFHHVSPYEKPCSTCRCFVICPNFTRHTDSLARSTTWRIIPGLGYVVNNHG